MRVRGVSISVLVEALLTCSGFFVLVVVVVLEAVCHTFRSPFALN